MSNEPLLAGAAAVGAAPKLLHYVFVSVPAADGDREKAIRDHCTRTADVGTSVKFEVPELVSGALDNLMNLSDELSKVDSFVESFVKKVSQTLTEIVEKDLQWAVGNVSVEQYLSAWHWDEKKFPWKVPLKEVVARIQSLVQRLDVELRQKYGAYSQLVRTLASSARKDAGTLMTKSLAEVVKPEDILETEYLTTLLVVVPRHMAKDWQGCYEKLTDFVLPRSSRLIKEDGEFGLWTITLFKRIAEDYKNAAREKRFAVREFDRAQFVSESKDERDKKQEEKAAQELKLVRWCKINFGEAFAAWVHVKAIRVFVESVLRYGPTTRFAVALLRPAKARDEKRNMGALCKAYAHLAQGVSGLSKVGVEEKLEAVPGVAQEKTFSFIYSILDLDLVRLQF